MLKKSNYLNTIKFSEYAVSKFNPHIYTDNYRIYGCGPTALGLITGARPHKFKYQKHYSDRFMVRHLQKRGYQVLPISREDVSQTPQFIVSHIKDHHVILASQLAIRGESTWIVIYGGYAFHNFVMEKLEPLDFLNRPLCSAYLIFHKKWL